MSSPRAVYVDGALAIVKVGTTDVAGVSITTRRYRLRGRYVMRTDNPAAAWPSHIQVTPLLIAGDAPVPAGISEGAPSGEFILHNVFGPCVLRPGYQLVSGSRWWFTQILPDGVDVTDIPTDFSGRPDAKLEVVFTQHPARIAGVVINASGSPCPARGSCCSAPIPLSGGPPRSQSWKRALTADSRSQPGLRLISWSRFPARRIRCGRT